MELVVSLHLIRVVNGHEQRNPVRTPDNRARVVSSDSRRQLDLRKQPNPLNRWVLVLEIWPSDLLWSDPCLQSSHHHPMTKECNWRKKHPSLLLLTGTGAPVPKQTVLNGQRRPVEKSRVPGVIRPKERNLSVQHTRDRVLKKENVVASNTQMRPQKQSSLRAN